MVRNKCGHLLKRRALLNENGRVHTTAESKPVVKYLAAQLPAIGWQARFTQQLSRLFICSIDL